jgi:hypothetical protein
MTTGKVSFQTVEYLLHLILELDEANTQLRLEAESIAADERVKIVAWLRSKQFLIPNDFGDIVADYIEAGEHLK